MSNQVKIPLSDHAEKPLLKKIGWDVRTMVSLKKAGLLLAEWDGSMKCYVATDAAIRLALEKRNEIIQSQILDLEQDAEG